MRNNKARSLLSVGLLITILFSPMVNAESENETTNANEEFIFSSQICMQWSNNSNVNLDAILFGGSGYNETLEPTGSSPSGFETIESEQEFLESFQAQNFIFHMTLELI
jgi:hypothetical protein